MCITIILHFEYYFKRSPAEAGVWSKLPVVNAPETKFSSQYVPFQEELSSVSGPVPFQGEFSSLSGP